MAKGTTWPAERQQYRDEVSGRTVWQLTNSPGVDHHPYFYHPPVTPDGRWMVFGSDRTGGRQLFRMEMATGEIRQLTEDTGAHTHSAVIAPAGGEVFYVAGPHIKAVTIADGAERVVARVPEGFEVTSTIHLSTDGTLLTYTRIKRGMRRVKADWSGFRETFEAHPHCALELVRTDGSGGHTVLEADCWLGHPQIRPGDNATLMYCYEGPWHLVGNRIWLVKADGTDNRSPRPQREGECIGHEYWLADGSRIVYLRFVRRTDRGPREEPGSVRDISPAGGDERVILEPCDFSHFSSTRDGARLVGDNQNADRPFLYLVETATGRSEPLCVHGSSWKGYGTTQDSHPHPAWSADERAVFFTSDRTGSPNVYMVEV